MTASSAVDQAGWASARRRRSTLPVRLWRRRGLFLAVFAAVLALPVVALLVLPVRYLASGSVIIAEQEPANLNASAAWAQKIGDPADLESQLLLIRSPRVVRLALGAPGVRDALIRECRAAEEKRGMLSGLLGGASGTACEHLSVDSDTVLENVLRNYAIGTVGRSRVISIGYQSALPDVAQTLANALIAAFLDDQRASMAKGRQEAAGWLWQEIRQLNESLRAEEAKIEAFRRDKGLIRGQNAPIAAERLTSLGQQLAAAEAARADAEARLREIAGDQARNSADSRAVQGSRAVADLKQQLAAADSQVARAALSLGERHPTLLSLQQERDNLRRLLAEEIRSIARNAGKVFEASESLVAALRRQVDEAKAEVATASGAEASIADMVRATEIKRQEYFDLYKKASDLETERRVLVGSTRLVSLAELPLKPFFPKRGPFLAAGLTLALMAAAGAALFLDGADRSVRASSDVAAVTGAATIAELPLLSPGRAPILGRFGTARPEPPLRTTLRQAAEDPEMRDAVRNLYAGLTLAGRGRDLRTVLVTSPAPQEGKTFTTLALAQLVAASGRRVLAVECDLRRPSFQGALDLEPSPGMSALLRGMILPREAVVQTRSPGLDAIPAGPPSIASTELLMGPHMAELLLWARKYDLVLLDSPPASILMDAAVLARQVDGVLCCMRWGASPVAEATASVAAIRSAGGEVLGTAVTMVRGEARALYEARTPYRAYLDAGAA